MAQLCPNALHITKNSLGSFSFFSVFPACDNTIPHCDASFQIDALLEDFIVGRCRILRFPNTVPVT